MNQVKDGVGLVLGGASRVGYGYSVLIIGQDREFHASHGRTEIEAEQALRRTIKYLTGILEGHELPTSAIRPTSLGWEAALLCPDGEWRLFVARDPKPPKPGRIGPTLKQRFEALKQAGFRCRYCGRSAPDVELHVDHVVPVVAGGSNEPENLVAACFDCNMGKSDRPL